MNREEKFKYNNKFVEEVEDKIDVNELQYKKVNFWPLMRLELMRQLPSKNIKIQKKIKLDFFNYFQVIFDYFLFIIRSRKPKKVNTLFFSDKEFYYNEIKNKKINLFIDASYLFYKKSKLKIELIPTYSRNREKKYFEPIYIKILFYDFLRYLIKKIFFKNRFENKIVINKYFSDILKKYKKLNFDFKKLQKDLDNIIFESKLFEKFFKEYKCKKVYLTCYYQTKNFAIILACKHLGIKTIDIQHGAQEEYHLMYSRFKQSPKNGYNLLPDYFQVWERNQINNYGSNLIILRFAGLYDSISQRNFVNHLHRNNAAKVIQFFIKDEFYSNKHQIFNCSEDRNDQQSNISNSKLKNFGFIFDEYD